ncbi:MAG: hypothetical protein WA194_02595 [Patescibacteria group bacterium]
MGVDLFLDVVFAGNEFRFEARENDEFEMPGVVFVVEARRKYDPGFRYRSALGFGLYRVGVETGDFGIRKRPADFLFERLDADSGAFQMNPTAFRTVRRNVFAMAAMMTEKAFFGRYVEREGEVAARATKGVRTVLAYESAVGSPAVEIHEHATFFFERRRGPVEKLPTDVGRELRGTGEVDEGDHGYSNSLLMNSANCFTSSKLW